MVLVQLALGLLLLGGRLTGWRIWLALSFWFGFWRLFDLELTALIYLLLRMLEV